MQPDSPGELAGLAAGEDYLLGTAEKVFKDTDALYDEVRKFLDSTVEFYVYSTASDEVRVVVVMPTEDWNGAGCLGLSVGHGYLHRLPSRCKQSTGHSIEPSRAPAPSNLTDATAGGPEAPEPKPPAGEVSGPGVGGEAPAGGAAEGEPLPPPPPAPEEAAPGVEGGAPEEGQAAGEAGAGK